VKTKGSAGKRIKRGLNLQEVHTDTIKSSHYQSINHHSFIHSFNRSINNLSVRTSWRPDAADERGVRALAAATPSSMLNSSGSDLSSERGISTFASQLEVEDRVNKRWAAPMDEIEMSREVSNEIMMIRCLKSVRRNEQSTFIVGHGCVPSCKLWPSEIILP
jgi:hypothetical protein